MLTVSLNVKTKSVFLIYNMTSYYVMPMVIILTKAYMIDPEVYPMQKQRGLMILGRVSNAKAKGTYDSWQRA